MGAPTESDVSPVGGEQARKRELKAYTFEEVAKHNTKDDCWMVVDDLVYNVTKFIPYHPGGSILTHYAGKDATDAFYAFHGEEPGSPGITALARYVVGRLDKPIEIPGYLADFRALRKQAASEGLMRVSIPWYAGLLTFYSSLYISALLLLWYLPHNAWSVLLSATIMGCCWAQGGLIQHDLGHNAIFWNVKRNNIAHVLFYTFLMGGSPDWWKGRHTRHHIAPNDSVTDLDIRTLPLFAWDKKQFKKSPQALTKWQVWYWPLLGPPLMLHVYRVLNSLWMIRRFNLFEASSLMLHFAFVGRLVWMGDIWTWMLWWTWTVTVTGTYLGWIFALNHTMFPIYREADDRDWVSATLTTTQNVSGGFFVDHLTGHLNYQVEHHLWPRMPRHNYEVVHPRLKEIAKKHNMPLYIETLPQALASVYRTLHNATLPETAEEATAPEPRAY